MLVLVNFVLSPATSPLPELPSFVLPLTHVSYLRWALIAGYTTELQHWSQLYDTLPALTYQLGVQDEAALTNLFLLFMYGLFGRLLATALFVFRRFG